MYIYIKAKRKYLLRVDSKTTYPIVMRFFLNLRRHNVAKF